MSSANNPRRCNFVADVSAAGADLTERLQADIKNAKLTALILAKVGAKGR